MRAGGQTDRHDETNSRLSQFYKGAYKFFGPHSLFMCSVILKNNNPPLPFTEFIIASNYFLCEVHTEFLYMLFVFKAIMQNF
jgi:hypothetical protein